MAKRGRPSKVELARREAEKEKTTILRIIVAIGFILFSAIIAQNVYADQMVHKFKSPSFSGINQSSHYLTIENQEFNRKKAIKEEIKAYQEQLKRDEENTTLARFLRNLESRIYAQLSRQLVDQLFGENPQTQGILELLGNTISYIVEGDMITLTITDSEGNVTVISLPLGSFTF
jgi:hypothetical protein